MHSSLHPISLLYSLPFIDSSNMHAILYLFLSTLICLLSINELFVEAKTSRRSFTIDLIHRDSPLSPFYNSSMTPSELLRNAALRSISRLNRFNQLSLNQNGQSPESIIVPNGGDYLMRIYIGTPPVERLAVADTGSDLIWVQCSPCKSPNCFPQDAPLFDPNNSSTFTLVPCDSQNCALLPQRQRACGKSNECDYLYVYGDKSYTIGELATESINFGSNSVGQGTTFPKSIFGCGYKNDVTFSRTRKATGLVGLGAGPLSLVSQLGDEIGNKFSYCLVPPSAPYNSKLKFGDEAIVSGNGVVSTPLITNPSHPAFYYLNLEGVSVGQNLVQNSQTSSGNIFIDSGTTLTYLEPNFYNKFVDSVKKALGVEPVQNPPDPFDFCFSYDGANNVKFPDIVLHFTGANVPLKPGNLFGHVDNNLLCLLAIPTSDGNYIFGNKAQINFQVEYDLEGKKVSFAPTDCTKN